MNILDRLFGRRPDPTAGWGTSQQPIPDFDLSQMRFGSLRFGDGIEAASFLGRPDRFAWTQADYCELLYARGGFQLDFDKGRFAYLAFFIGPDKFVPTHEGFEFSQPRLRGCAQDGARLSREMDQPALERLVNAPDSADSDAAETILYYTRQGITMEFEMDGKSGRLKRWNLYPK